MAHEDESSTDVTAVADSPAGPCVSALVRAVRAGIAGESESIAELFTDDVEAWTPALHASSAAALAVEFEDRDEAFTDIEIDIVPLEVGDQHACVEWTAYATFSGPLSLDDNGVIEPTNERFAIRGVTVADFDGPRICAFRQYWDEGALLEHLGRLRE